MATAPAPAKGAAARLQIKTTVWKMVVALRDKKLRRTGLHTDAALMASKRYLQTVVFAVDETTAQTQAQSLARMHLWLHNLACGLVHNLRPFHGVLVGLRQWEESDRLAVTQQLSSHEQMSKFQLDLKYPSLTPATKMLMWQWLQRLYKQCAEYVAEVQPPAAAAAEAPTQAASASQ